MKQRVILIVLAAAVVGTAGVAVANRSSGPAPDRVSPTPTVSIRPSAVPKSAARKAPPRSGSSRQYGHVEGPVTYPGEGVPGDIRVCAVNLPTARETCTGKIVRHGRFKSGRGYRLRVAPGNYQVYAVAPSFDPGYQAFYSAFVVCGYHVGCTDHSPITISVEAGKIRTGIEPGDFYD